MSGMSQQRFGVEQSRVSLTGTVWQCPAEEPLNARRVPRVALVYWL
jgi:hypothetical protein